MLKNLEKMTVEIILAYDAMISNLSDAYNGTLAEVSNAYNAEDRINNLRNYLRDAEIESFESEQKKWATS